MSEKIPPAARANDNVPARRCPICGMATADAYRPFCSRRCSDVDLNRWFSGVYAVPVREDDDETASVPDESSARD
ncbi:MAG TPA: DNA gyrase inhibitor YacG [Xanthobacteraceae bacterium]